mgnify:CR=1 FL=1
MILKNSDYLRRLQKEFNLSERQVESITIYPFKFIAAQIRKKEDVAVRLNDFLMFSLKPKVQKIYDSGKDNRDNESLRLNGQSNGGAVEDSREEIGGVHDLPTEERQ